MTIEQNLYLLAESAFDDGYNKCKQDMLNIISGYINGPYDDRARDMLYNIKEDIEKL